MTQRRRVVRDDRVLFESKATGTTGHSECFEWILKHCTHSYHEATTNRGYSVEPFTDPGKPPTVTVSFETIKAEYLKDRT